MAQAGQIEYTIVVDDSGLKKGLNDAKKEATSFSDKMTSVGKAGAKALGKTLVAGAVSATVAIAKMTKEAISSFAEFEQLSGGIEAMFGGMEKGAEQITKVNQYASDAWKDLTMSQNEYFRSFSDSYALVKTGIEDENKAIEETNRLLQLNADLSNFYGYDIERASNAINWALKGSFNYLDNLNIGIVGTQEGFLDAAHACGYMVKSVKELNSEQIIDIIERYAEKAGVVGTTAREAANTIQGSTKMMKSAWQNLLTGMADDTADFKTLMDNFMKSAGLFGKQVFPRIKTAFASIVQFITQALPEVISALNDVIADLLPAIIEGVRVLFIALVENFPRFLDVIIDNIDVLVDGILDIIEALIPRLPEILVKLVEAVVKAIISIISNLGERIGNLFVAIFENGIKPFFEGIFSFFGDFAEGALQAFDNFGKGVSQGLQNIGQWFHDVFKGIWDFIVSVFKGIGDFFAGIWEGIKNTFVAIGTNIGNAFANAFKAVVNGVLSFVEGIVNGVVNIINIFADAINALLGAISGGQASIGRLNHVNFPRMATGGIVEAVQGGQLILAGEAGQDEWVVPESKMASLIDKINEQGGTTSGITINIQGVFATSDAEQRAVAEQIYEKLQEINKSRMGAYL